MSGIVNKNNGMSSQYHSVPMRGEGDCFETRSLENGSNISSSPLKLFGQAKTKINGIFNEIGNYVDETRNFLSSIDKEDIVNPDVVGQANGYQQKVCGILEVLTRDHMKVVFFGRTSNGKSTVINAMLRNKLLPSGIGHTTNCFVQVEGCDSSEGYLLTEDSGEKKSINSVKQLAHALSSMKLGCNSLIRILWPKEKCSLLKDDVVLVDSPGIDVSPDLDSWIDKHCMDADVFVLVANAESTLMQTEKNFFLKVSDRLSKPNVFILNNRWDASAMEPESMDEVKQQHIERNIAFLTNELHVNTKQEAEDRVFFVSAREALTTRSHHDAGTPTPTGVLQEGFQGRLFEFASFERKFEECISQSAVKTKFAQHTKRGKVISEELKSVMDNVHSNSLEKRRVKVTKRQETSDRLDYMERQMDILTEEIKVKIKQMVEQVETKVSRSLNDEIRRLAILVDEFDRPFHPDSMVLGVYKKELHAHVEQGLGRNLQSRCSTTLLQGVEDQEKAMIERLTALLPDESKQQAAGVLPRRDFEVAYRLDCRNLCADFNEDIEFRFSLGITSLVKRFLGKRGARVAMMGYNDAIPRPMPMTPQTPSNENRPIIDDTNVDVMLALIRAFPSVMSSTSVGAVVVTGVITKVAGWKVIAVCGALYGLVYAYERLTWTNKAKERCFKRQYVEYASSKLKLIVDLTSANCSHQVQQELSSSFARLSHQVDIAKSELEADVKVLDHEICQLEDITKKAKVFKNKAEWFNRELESFSQQFLHSQIQK